LLILSAGDSADADMNPSAGFIGESHVIPFPAGCSPGFLNLAPVRLALLDDGDGQGNVAHQRESKCQQKNGDEPPDHRRNAQRSPPAPHWARWMTHQLGRDFILLLLAGI